MKQKTINRLAASKWYHATTLDCWKSICKLKVRADFNKLQSNDNDFGYGFYLTDTAEKAESFNDRMAEANFIDGSKTVIIEFEFKPLTWFQESTYNTKVFETPDQEFAEFVFFNRTENFSGEKQHNYCAIYGVMSDSLPTVLLTEYEMGKIQKDDVLEGFKKDNRMKQLSLHSQELCDIIKPRNVYMYNTVDKSRKELDVNDYYN